MTTTLTKDTSETTGWSDRHTGVAGIVFVILLVAAFMTSGNTPENDASAQEWTSWFEDSGNRSLAIVSIFLFIFAVAALIPFAAGLVERIRRVPGDAGVFATVTMAGGIVLGSALVFGGILIGSVAGSYEFGDMPLPSAEVMQAIEGLGFGVLLLGSGLGSFLFIGGMSLAARKNGALPTWLAIAGAVAAVILLFTSLMFMPMVLLALWALVVSIVCLRGGSNTGPASS